MPGEGQQTGGAGEAGSAPATRGRLGLLAALGPGILVAATGVGAGDLATASLAGSRLGVAVLWAVVAGALLKYALNEGLARWQLATGTTLVAGAVRHLGRGVAFVFLPYLLLWSFCVGSALMGACGVTAAAFAPGLDPAQGKVVFGLLSGLAGAALVLAGGFRLFEQVMALCVGAMVLSVVVTAAVLLPDAGTTLRGLLVPDPDTLRGPALGWTLALMGGVGGTLTILAYGYWIREEGRVGPQDLALCRVDLGVAYAMTALFGLAMVVIGSTIPAEGSGARLIVDLAARLEERLGPLARWAFLLGAWGAVFSSVLGVWQSVPYIFCDFVAQVRAGGQEAPAVDARSRLYRGYVLALATVPALALPSSFARVQQVYALVGACFMPLLALALLLLLRRPLVGDLRSGWLGRLSLLVTLAFFLGVGAQEVLAALS